MDWFKERFFKIFGKLDPVLFVCATLLSIISIVTIIGAVDNFGASKLRMQIAMFVVGVVVTVVISHIDFRVIVDKLWFYMLVGSALLLLVTLLFGSSGQNMETANRSWLKIPFTGLMIQPSEFIKFTFICTFAKHLFSVRESINKPLTLLFLACHAGLIVGLILLSGDLGVALVYLVIVAIMLFCAGLHPLYFVGVILAVVLLAPFLWEHLEPYQQMRITAGFNPEAYLEVDPDLVRQPLQSKATIAAGGLFGNGIMGGSLYETLPASHTDFIYATVCEKFGFLGGALVIIIFIVMVVRVFMIARTATGSDYGGLICVGVGGMLIVQILLNVGMCFAILPVIGITLPFLSCGGSSMLATFMMFGLLHSVYSHSDAVRDFERVDTFDIDISLLDS
ncbi:MAG: FtsW/RodA/SpoVE family cell cycle protein [Clostridia bacterium]|nr:FtsW/RodA/SpoVE family cell cycle protein [Clostridia bacterium]